MPRRHRLLGGLAAAALVAGLPATASAQTSTTPVPDKCTPDIQYDASVPTFQSVTGRELGAGPAGRGTTPATPGATPASNSARVLNQYFDAVVAATAGNPRVRVLKKQLAPSVLGVPRAYYVISTVDNIANLDTGRGDAAFWAGVREGTISEADGLQGARSRPGFGWITATPHGNEPSAGEAIARQLYELAARLDCANAQRLRVMDLFLLPVTNPDGRDNNVRTVAWGFDPNRDLGTRQLQENQSTVPQLNSYPAVFFIDAHQQTSGFFFPPNEDPVHHEISTFSLDLIQNRIGPALQAAFNDQSAQYRNYNQYDLFTPEYGDTVPSLISGAAGMTYEKGVNESYGKQVYDHFLSMDTTINTVANAKQTIMEGWVKQWKEAVDEGARGELEPNKLVSPLHDDSEITQQPSGKVFGYVLDPTLHTGDTARLITSLQEVGVRVERLKQAVTVPGLRKFGAQSAIATLPAGTLYIPMAQAQKHWIQAVLGEDPFIPYPYFYDVVTWSYPLQRGLAGDGWLTEAALPAGTTEPIGAPDLGSGPASAGAVYAFDTDSMSGLGLAAELLAAGVDVDRSGTAFDAAGRHFETGTALVDATTLGSTDLAAAAKARQTPVTALPGYPVAHFDLAKPKVGLYTGAATIPTNPLYPTGANVSAANTIGPDPRAGQCTSTAFCEALYVLTQKDRLPAGTVVPVTSDDLAAGALRTQGFTALINPAATIAAGAAQPLQDFVNAGGRYVGYNAGGATSARNAGLTGVNTTSLAGLSTPGSTFDGTFDTTDPVAWGFDLGGWIYRDANANPVFDPATLAASGTRPAAVAAVSYGGAGDAPLRTYGYEVGGRDGDPNPAGGAPLTGRLDGRPAVVHQRFGAGHAVLFGFNPFYRAWKEQDERLVLNAAMIPGGDAKAATAAPARSASAAPATDAQPATGAAAPIPAAALPAVATRPVVPAPATDRDVRITVRPTQAGALRAAVRAAKLPAKARKRTRYVTTRKQVTLVVRGIRTNDEHARQAWTSRVMARLRARHVTPLSAQL